MAADLQNPIFHDLEKAREALEAIRWPDGPVCPHCGITGGKIGALRGKSHRPGLFYCGGCKGQFTVTVGTMFERSKIPLTKWWLAAHLLSASKRGMSAHQLGRMLGLTYKSAWFLAHRVREAMGDVAPGPLGGANQVVEADETYVGGASKNRAHRKPAPKKAVVSLVERGGEVRSSHVANVSSKNLRPILVRHTSRASTPMTDESTVYSKIGGEFANHLTVNHSAGEYVRLGSFVHTNTAEGVFSLLKRGITGVYHHLSEAHLGRYLAEFGFRYNNRKISDAERAALRHAWRFRQAPDLLADWWAGRRVTLRVRPPNALAAFSLPPKSLRGCSRARRFRSSLFICGLGQQLGHNAGRIGWRVGGIVQCTVPVSP